MRRRLQRLLAETRLRVLATIVILLAFSAVLSVVAIRQLLTAQTIDRIDERLSQEVEEFRRVSQGRDPATGARFGSDIEAIFAAYFRRNVPRPADAAYGFIDGRLVGGRAGRLGSQGELGDAVVPLAAVRGETARGELDTPEGAKRYIAVPIEGRRGQRAVFAVTTALAAANDQVEDAVWIAALVLAAVMLIASALAWALLGRMLAPIRLVSDTARAISEADLSRRIPVRGRDELAELTRTFNGMLERLETAFGLQRAFVSDASHELRTPITIVRGHLELMGDDPEEKRQTVALVTDELDRMNRFVDDLLTLARAERNDFLHPTEVELGALTDELFSKARALGDRDWRLASRAEGTLFADRQRLTQAAMGLAQNACQQTQPGDRIVLGSARASGHVRLWVADRGPGVPHEEQERIFQRFARARNARRHSDGAGLGLAIVRAIAEAHGGHVELESRPGEGATFTLIIPERDAT